MNDMATADVYAPSVPRLRLSRHSPSDVYDNTSASSSSQAGPSRLPDVTQLVDLNFSDLNTDPQHNHDEEDDQQPTPKTTTLPPVASSSPADTPAARLRALLSRVPTSRSPATPMPRLHSPSELESDFEPPEPTSATPSMARESLKDIFSRALRDPGDTPQKGGKRRNSIDVSEVDASPRVQKERSSIKGKRKSLSDEEVENPPKFSQRSTTSFKSSSQPITLDILRERFSNSQSEAMNLSSASPYQRDDSNDTATILRELNSSRATPPAATSTPQHSLRMSGSSQLQFQSNLLEQDSEMQRAIDAFDSYEGDSGLNQGTEDERFTNHQEYEHVAPARAQSPSPSGKSNSIAQSHGNSSSHRSADPHHSASRSGSMSSHSVLGNSESHRHDEDQELSHQREREWNKSKTSARSTTPEFRYPHQHSHPRTSITGSPSVGRSTLSRRGSAASLGSFDGLSSKGSSVGSQAEYRERINELERERNHEREREWNKRHPTITRPTSSLSLRSPAVGGRSRTQSFPHSSRPDSAQSHRSLASPESFPATLRRHHSFNSSRASSPSGSSRASHDDDPAVVGVVHERERNWNAPRPKWDQHTSAHQRSNSNSDSPAPQSPSSSLRTSQHHLSYSNGRIRAESLKTPGTSKGEFPVHRGSGSGSKSAKAKSADQVLSRTPPREQTSLTPSTSRFQSTLQALNADSSRSVDFPARTRSPLPSSLRNATIKSPSNTHSSRIQTPSSSMARTRAPLSPFVREKTPAEPRPPSRSVASPSPTPISNDGHARASGSTRQSQIPVRSPKKARVVRAAPVHEDVQEISADELPSSSKIEDLRTKSADGLSISDEMEAMSQERTPTLRTVPPPPLETPEYTPPRIASPPARSSINDELRLQNAIAFSSRSPIQEELSPLPSPPAEAPEPQLPSFLSTPPRRSSFSTSKLEFQTPSPPKGLPELPGPPSSSEDEDTEDDPVPRWGATPNRPNGETNPNWTAMKTPRPPGGFSQTPNGDREGKRPTEWTDTSPSRYNENEGANWTAMKTPKPPGAWAATPMPTQRTRGRSDSIETEPEETESHNGLATPVASLSRASSLPLQTPAPPGAWAATPATKRSILKVRFEAKPSEPEHSDMREMDESSEGPDSARHAIKASLDASTELQRETDVRVSTPEPISPVSPPSRSPRSPRKAPSIRVLDAFGREEKQVAEPQTPRSKSAVRILDAMGREVKESEPPVDETEEQEPMPPLDRKGAFSRVREGLGDIMHGLDEMDKASEEAAVHNSHIADLERASRSAREARERLTKDMRANEAELLHKLRPSQSTKGKQIPSSNEGRVFAFLGWRMIVAFLVLQLLLYAVMYRFTVMKAKDMFLTTYYDPFYPHLHLYTSRPDTLHYSIPSSPSRTSWLSTPGIFFREGWITTSERILDNLSRAVTEWQLRIWEAWGSGSAPPTKAWPPT